MNREQRRALKYKKSNRKKEKILMDDIYIPEGTKVKLDLKKIQGHPDYMRLTENYRKFVEGNKDTIFTVEYDKFRENPSTLVCLKEDPTPIKWLFWTGFLIKIEK